MSLASGMLDAVKNATSEQLREIGETFLWFADQQRDEVFLANIDIVIAKFRDPREDDIAAHLEAARERMRKLEEPLIRDGLNHRRLMEEELARRGDARSVTEYLRDIDATSSSDVERSWLRDR